MSGGPHSDSAENATNSIDQSGFGLLGFSWGNTASIVNTQSRQKTTGMGNEVNHKPTTAQTPPAEPAQSNPGQAFKYAAYGAAGGLLLFGAAARRNPAAAQKAMKIIFGSK